MIRNRSAGRRQEHLPQRRDAATDDRQLRVEQVDEHADRGAEGTAGALDDRQRRRVASRCHGADETGGHRLGYSRPSQGFAVRGTGNDRRFGRDRPAADERFETADTAAMATRAVDCDGDVPHLTAEAIGSLDEDTVGQDATSDPSTQCQIDKVLNADAAAESRFAKRGAVAVIANGERSTGSRPKRVSKGEVTPIAQIGSEGHDPPL